MNQSKARDTRQRNKWIRSGALNREELLTQLIQRHSHPELAQRSGHVLQVWHDGEVTSQKAGDLLWQRTLHCLAGSILAHKGLWKLFPETVSTGTFIFTDEAGALEIRRFIRQHYFPEASLAAFDYRGV